MKNKFSNTKIFYGWIIVAAGLILMSSAMGIAYNCASLFLEPVSEELFFTRQEVNTTITIRFMCQMIIALFSGKIFAKYDVKRLMQISSIVLPISYFSYSFSNTLITYYAITFIVSISVVFLTILPLSLILSNWFHERRGFATGIAFMGSGVGGMIFNFLAGIWITLYGWRVTYQILAVLMFLAIVPCVFFLIRIHPREMGLSALGEVDKKDIKSLKIEEEGLLLSEAIKTKHFWAIALCGVLVSMSINTLMINIAPHLTDIGYSTRFSANIVSMSMGSLAIFKVVLGQLYDKLGLRWATTISCLATFFGLLGLIFSNYALVLIVVIVCVGLGCSFGTMANPIIAQKVFGRKDYSSIYGVLTAATGIGGIVSPVLNGYIFDTTGSYNLGFIIMILLISIAITIYQFVFSSKVEKSKMKLL